MEELMRQQRVLCTFCGKADGNKKADCRNCMFANKGLGFSLSENIRAMMDEEYINETPIVIDNLIKALDKELKLRWARLEKGAEE